jgi:hypothetical protein
MQLQIEESTHVMHNCDAMKLRMLCCDVMKTLADDPMYQIHDDETSQTKQQTDDLKIQTSLAAEVTQQVALASRTFPRVVEVLTYQSLLQ